MPRAAHSSRIRRRRSSNRPVNRSICCNWLAQIAKAGLPVGKTPRVRSSVSSATASRPRSIASRARRNVAFANRDVPDGIRAHDASAPRRRPRPPHTPPAKYSASTPPRPSFASRSSRTRAAPSSPRLISRSTRPSSARPSDRRRSTPRSRSRPPLNPTDPAAKPAGARRNPAPPRPAVRLVGLLQLGPRHHQDSLPLSTELREVDPMVSPVPPSARRRRQDDPQGWSCRVSCPMT